MTEKSLGCLGVLDGDGTLSGIITDGDLRRHMSPDLLGLRAGDVMTPNPKTMAPEELAAEALHAHEHSQDNEPVHCRSGKPVGVVHVHDLLRLGIA